MEPWKKPRSRSHFYSREGGKGKENAHLDTVTECNGECKRLSVAASIVHKELTEVRKTVRELSEDNAILKKAAETESQEAASMKARMEEVLKEVCSQLDGCRSELDNYKMRLERTRSAAEDASDQLSKAALVITKKDEDITKLNTQLEALRKENEDLKKLLEGQTLQTSAQPPQAPPHSGVPSPSAIILPSLENTREQNVTQTNVDGPSSTSAPELGPPDDILRLNRIVSTKAHVIKSLENEVKELRDQHLALKTDRDSRIREMTNILDVVKRGKRKAEDDFLEEREAKRRAREDLSKEIERREDAENSLAFEKRERDRLLTEIESMGRSIDSELAARRRLEDDIFRMKQNSTKLASKIQGEWRERVTAVENQYQAAIQEKSALEEKLRVQQEAEKEDKEKVKALEVAIASIQNIVNGVVTAQEPSIVAAASRVPSSISEGPAKPPLIQRFGV